MMKILHFLKVFVALVLMLTIALMVPLQTSAAAKTGKYVSEVYVAYGEDAASAKKYLEDNEFTPVEGNLNEGGETYAMMGYKTTDNIRDSITDLAVMNMRGDFSVEDYKYFLKAKKSQIAEFLNEFMTVVREYRENLYRGKEKAKYVHDLLNNYVDPDTGMKMGDLFNNPSLQDMVGVNESITAKNPDKLPDLVTILLQGNAQIIKSFLVLLSMASDTGTNTWLDRFAELDYDSLLDKTEEERPDLNTKSKRIQYLDSLYGAEADALGTASVKFADQLTDYQNSQLHIDTATEQDIQNTFGNITEDADKALQYQNWLSIGTIYEGLKNYEGGRYQKGELLDFFLEKKDPEDTEAFLPMAAALSDGQRSGMPFIGFDRLMSYSFTTEEGWKEFADRHAHAFDKIDNISIYQNIDRDLYKEDGSVALTGAAQRANNTADGTTGDKQAQFDTLSKITVISWAATAGLGLAALTSLAVEAYRDSRPLVTAVDSTLEALFRGEESIAFINEADISLGEINEAEDLLFALETPERLGAHSLARSLAKILFVATLVLAVISAVITVIDLCSDKSVEQLQIPKYLVDNYTDADGGSYALNYKAVECNREDHYGPRNFYLRQWGPCADINADEGKQWLVLYASKNSKAGRPLTPDFVIQESSMAPSGYDGFVHLIGEKGAVNIISPAFKQYSTFSETWQTVTGNKSKYIFCKHSSDIKTYDQSAGNMTASTFGSGMTAVWGFGGLALGMIIGAVGAVLINKNKKKKENT